MEKDLIAGAMIVTGLVFWYKFGLRPFLNERARLNNQLEVESRQKIVTGNPEEAANIANAKEIEPRNNF